MKKFKLGHPTEKLLIFIIVMLIGLVAAILWFYGYQLNILWQQNGNGNLFGSNQQDTNQPVSADLKFYLQSAVKSLYNSQPVTDPVQQKVYFPEARFYVPYSDYARTVVYRYTDASGSVPAGGTFTTSFNTTILPTTFRDVPCIQRNVSLVVDNNDRNYGEGNFVKSVKLADGRTLHIYQQDNKKDCTDLKWQAGSTDPLVKLLEQAKSY
jgi:hypothetical protein